MKHTLIAAALLGAATLTQAAGFTLSSPSIKANAPIAPSFEFNGFGVAAWGGMCPPAGAKPHRYIFTVHALKDKLEVPADATAALTGYMINGNSLGKASFTATYGRPKAK
jgi:phosphatidylethanolamine-binding protein (PEBP) family uncharacterized protein